jgi:hypothetical protein
MNFDDFKDENYEQIRDRAGKIGAQVRAEAVAKYQRDPKATAEIIADKFDECHASILIYGAPADFVLAIKATLRAGAQQMADRIDIDDIAARELWEEHHDAEEARAERMARHKGEGQA